MTYIVNNNSIARIIFQILSDTNTIFSIPPRYFGIWEPIFRKWLISMKYMVNEHIFTNLASISKNPTLTNFEI
jgi:hypothetical protein